VAVSGDGCGVWGGDLSLVVSRVSGIVRFAHSLTNPASKKPANRGRLSNVSQRVEATRKTPNRVSPDGI
jgi:hypothetical protein